MTTAKQNFEEIVKQLEACSPNQKALDFLNKIVSQIRAKGDEWIEANKFDLRVDFVPSEKNFPVSDNRLFYIGEFQMALLNK